MNIIRKIFNRIRGNNNTDYYRKQGMEIGSGCEIYSSVSFGSEPYLVSIGNNVRINSGVRFITHDGGMWVVRNMYPEYSKADLFGAIKVGSNVHIGTNSIIMPGVTIGDNCIIGCGAIVTNNVPSDSVAVGIPARVIESIEEYVKKNKDSFIMTKGLTNDEKKNAILNLWGRDIGQ